MKYLSLNDILNLHNQVFKDHGGTPGIRDKKLLESAIAQPQMTFDGQDLNPTITDKAGTLAYHLIKNHAFI